jgi:hypothetical protein
VRNLALVAIAERSRTVAVFLILTDAEYEALIAVCEGWKQGIKNVGTPPPDRAKLMDAELKLVTSIEQKLKNAG